MAIDLSEFRIAPRSENLFLFSPGFGIYSVWPVKLWLVQCSYQMALLSEGKQKTRSVASRSVTSARAKIPGSAPWAAWQFLYGSNVGQQQIMLLLNNLDFASCSEALGVQRGVSKETPSNSVPDTWKAGQSAERHWVSLFPEMVPVSRPWISQSFEVDVPVSSPHN